MRTLAIAAALLFMVPVGGATWSQFQGDAHHSGNAGAGLVAFDEVWWTDKLAGEAAAPTEPDNTPAQVTASPVVKDGVVVIGDWKGRVRALDADTGAEKWRTSLTGKISATAAIEGNKVFVVNEAGSLKSFDLATGTELATATVGATLASPTVDAGKLYIGNDAGEMKAYDTDTLTLDWKFQVTTVKSTYSVNPDTGVVTCKDPHPTGQIRGAPVVFDGNVLFGALNDHFYAVSANGNPDGTTDIEWFFKAGDDIVATPTINAFEKEVVFAAYDGYVYSITAKQSGQGTNQCYGKVVTNPVWKYQVDATASPRLRSSPATDGAFVYFGAPDGRVHAIKGSNGQHVWSATTGDSVNSAPSVSGAYVVVGSNDGKVYWLVAENGTLASHFTAGSPVESNPALDGDHAFATSFDGSTYRLGPAIPRSPDLALGVITVTMDTVTISISNIGDAAAPASQLTIEVDGALVATVDIAGIGPDGSTELSHPVTMTGGDHTVRITLDSSNVVAESDESNNAQEQSVTLTEAAGGGEKKKGLPGPGLLLVGGLLVVAAALRRR